MTSRVGLLWRRPGRQGRRRAAPVAAPVRAAPPGARQSSPPCPEVRPSARSDRDQLTALVDRHLAAVVPGWAVSTAALLAVLERDPGQYVTEPWVRDRCTLVAVVRDRLVAAAHLRRYCDDPSVGPAHRGVGEIAWLVAAPEHPAAAAAALTAACVARLETWRVRRQYADGDLPTGATCGVPDTWPHVGQLLRAAGFDDRDARTEVHLAGGLGASAPPGPPRWCSPPRTPAGW